MASTDGMNYAPPVHLAEPVCEPGQMIFAAAYFDHGHIYGQIKGLAAYGGTLKYLHDPEPQRLEPVLRDFPEARVVDDFREILSDPDVRLVTSAAIPHQRSRVGLQVLDAGKDYLTDKSPFTTLEQLEKVREKVEQTGGKYACCYSERLMNEACFYAGELVRGGAIGEVIQILNLAPHNLRAEARPDWFFEKEKYGGILTDIGSHQFEQFLHFTGSESAEIEFARVENLHHSQYPGLEDFGEACLRLPNGASAYCRLDWFNPAGLRSWGDGRTFVIGTGGSIEIRKTIDVARETGGDLVFLVDDQGEFEIPCRGKVGFPFFGKLITDILERSETAMTQKHCFAAAELSMKAQIMADQNRKPQHA